MSVELPYADGTQRFNVSALRNYSGMFVMLRVGERYVALRAPADVAVTRAARDSAHPFADVAVAHQPLAPSDAALRRDTPTALLVAPEIGAHYAALRAWPLGKTVLFVPRRYRLATRHQLDGSDDWRAVLAIDELYVLQSPQAARRRLFPDDQDDESSGGWIERRTDDF